MTINASEYVAEVEAWRRGLEGPLRQDWVSLVGRVELQPGSHRVGADPSAEVGLPAGSAPREVGALTLADGQVSFTPAPGAAVAVNGGLAAGAMELRSDSAADGPDIVAVGSVSFFIIERGPRTIVRVRDSRSPRLAAFRGRRWFPVDEAFRVEGRFTPYDPPKPLAIANVLGDISGQASPGYVTFTLGGQEHRLEATGWREGGLTLHFRDATSGELTPGGGRSLATTPPAGGLVLIDFNRAANLPCAFTEFATCPLPPAQNRLPVAVTAGELLPEFAG